MNNLRICCRLARRQTIYLQKYAAFAKNHNLYDSKQGDLREKCMEYWKVPMKSRKKDTDPRSVAEAKNMHSVLGTYSTKARRMGAIYSTQCLSVSDNGRQ